MATVAVSQVKLGDKIVQDVLTPLGSVLFHKGRVITPRELEVLQAFLVPTVVVGSSGDKKEEETAVDKTQEQAKAAPKSPFMDQYDRTVTLLKSVSNQVMSGMALSILEIRNQLEALLAHINDYKILTFSPSSVKNKIFFTTKVLCRQ